ncbi:MAG: chromosome segregation protein ScpA [Candidatus Methanomethylophilaceae archaeon]|nr:chromosome segregation protein ScpA [Candidatus Methanomethylophilaceae archaeon]
MAADITDLEQHLLFHKAVSDDEESFRKIGGYMEILAHAETGERLADPVDEAIRAVFSLVLDSGMDPWEIDLSEFVKLYSAKVRDDDFDMIVAGKLMLMAWKILRLQSDSTCVRSEPPPEPELEEFMEDPPIDDFVRMEVPDVVFREAYRREPVRPVTMYELIDAFEDARREIDIMRERERVRQAMKAKEPKKRFDNKAHDEDDEKTVEAVWEKIRKMGAGQMDIQDLYGPDRYENLSIFVSLLHLVRNGFIDVWQDGLPSGAIHLEIKNDTASGTVVDEPQEAEV